jgi:hypothetical protein
MPAGLADDETLINKGAVASVSAASVMAASRGVR